MLIASLKLIQKNLVINRTVDVEDHPIFTTRTKLNYLIV
jgi:hypothetical protein